MHPVDRRKFIELLGKATAAGLLTSGTAGAFERRAFAQTAAALPMGRRFVHVNFSNGGLGWLYTMLLPPSYLDATNKSELAMWSPSLPLERVTTPKGGSFVIPRPVLDAFEANGERGAFEKVLDGCVAFLGCGAGAPIHQTYAPSFQLSLGTRTTDISSEVASHQQFVTQYPMINMGSSLFGTGPRAFLAVPGNDVAGLFERITSSSTYDDAEVDRLTGLLNALNGDNQKGPYARTLSTQLVATRDSTRLFKPSPQLISQLSVNIEVQSMSGTRLPFAMQPLAVQLGRLDLADELTQGGVNTYNVASIEIGALGVTTAAITRGVAGVIQAMENGIGAENVQLDGVQDDPHNRIAELHAVSNTTDLYSAMLIKLFWLFKFLVELEKRGLFQDTTVLVDGDFSRVLNKQWDDGGVNAVALFSGGGRLRPGFYGDSGVDGGVYYRIPDLLGAAGTGNFPGLLAPQRDGGSELPHKLCLGITLLAMGMSPAEAGAAAQMREDELKLIEIFAA